MLLLTDWNETVYKPFYFYLRIIMTFMGLSYNEFLKVLRLCFYEINSLTIEKQTTKSY